MSYTFQDLMNRLRKVDEVSLLEILDISSEELVDRFQDMIEERMESLIEEFEEEQEEEQQDELDYGMD